MAIFYREVFEIQIDQWEKSGVLLVLILGYIAGIANKLINSYDVVVYLYILNLLMVSIDAILWIRNKKTENDCLCLIEKPE